MRRTILLLATMTVTLVVASGVALAVTKIGTDGPDRLRGTNGADQLVGKGGNDILLALAGNDTMVGGPGKDILFGGEFDQGPVAKDTISAGDGNDVMDIINIPAGKDVVSCGSSVDWVLADKADVLAPDCERVFVGEGKIDAYFRSIPPSFFPGLAPLPEG